MGVAACPFMDEGIGRGAPSTRLRLVPLPRYAEEEQGENGAPIGINQPSVAWMRATRSWSSGVLTYLS